MASKPFLIAGLSVGLIASLSVSADATVELSPSRRMVRQPRWLVTVGPVTVVSVYFLNLPFIRPYYVVRFKSDDGEFIEIRHSGVAMPLFEGMRGILTYHAYPQRILDFREVAQDAAK